ncbi:MAG TPA: hypothetical protein EYP33_05080 [Pyrodictium sp.]|nr:hypothetical protein [Pyrodictium sp.]
MCDTSALQAELEGLAGRSPSLAKARRSPAEIELAVPQSVRVAVETLLAASSVSIVVDGKRVHRGFMEPGYKEAGQRLRVVIEGAAGSAKVNVKRLRG